MRKALVALCVVSVLTLGLLVAVNLVAAWLNARAVRPHIAAHPVFNEAVRAKYEQIYQLPIATVREIVSECWAENAWIFEPYVQFRERPREGRFVNISVDGFRRNGPEGAKTFDPTRTSAVFLFGGSTTFGYGVRDEDTVAAHLEALLRRDPSLGAHVAVYNFGRGYYGSSQEILLLKSLVQRGMLPAVAVFIDGVNEQFCPTYSANIAEVFKTIQADPRAQLRAAVAALPMMRLFAPDRRAELAVNALFFNRELSGYTFECGCPPASACHEQFRRMLLLNKQLIRAMGKEFGFDTHFVLQPVGGYRNRFAISPEGTPQPDRAALWQWLERQTMGGENDHSFSGILEDYGGEAFVDTLHYTSGVNRLIAERLHPSVARSLAKVSRK